MQQKVTYPIQTATVTPNQATSKGILVYFALFIRIICNTSNKIIKTNLSIKKMYFINYNKKSIFL